MYFNEKNKDTDVNSEFEKEKLIDWKKTNKITRLVIYIGGSLLVIILILLLVLKKPEEKIKYFLELNGVENVLVYEGNKYTEDGYRAYDSSGNKYDDEVITEGNVNSMVPGDYEIIYKFKDIEKKRKVKVISLEELKSYIKLVGDNPSVVSVYDTYVDSGVDIIPSQYMNKKMLENIKIDNGVDTSKVGTYEVVYTLTNDDLVNFSISRTVVVTDKKFVLWYSPTSSNVNKVLIQGVILEDFEYMLLPNGEKSKDRKFSYEVTENNSYSFKLFDNSGNFIEEIIDIKNIVKK